MLEPIERMDIKMIKNKLLDMTTDKGMRKYNYLCTFYPSLKYGIKENADILMSEGITHVLTCTKELIVVSKILNK